MSNVKAANVSSKLRGTSLFFHCILQVMDGIGYLFISFVIGLWLYLAVDAPVQKLVKNTLRYVKDVFYSCKRRQIAIFQTKSYSIHLAMKVNVLAKPSLLHWYDLGRKPCFSLSSRL